MIRLTLRQFRAEGIIGAGLLGAVAIVLLITGPHLAQVNDTFLAACKTAGDCASQPNPVAKTDQWLKAVLPFLVVVAPALVGVFFGAPLVARELESGTFRLVWTQSVTRSRWLMAKLGCIGLASMVLCGVLTLIVNWWARPLDALNQNRFSQIVFSFHGVVPFGYGAFAFALGVLAGTMLRRTVPAIAVTIVGFIGARLAVTYWIRPNFASPARLNLPVSAASGVGFSRSPSGAFSLAPPNVSVPNAWVYSTSFANRAGQSPSSQFIKSACSNLAQGAPSGNGAAGIIGNAKRAVPAPSQDGFTTCMDHIAAHFHIVAVYQPASRYWPFQWAEAGVFFAAALVLAGWCYLWIRRRAA